MKRILIGTVAIIMVMPAFADDPWEWGLPVPMGGYACTVTYNCGDGTGASRSYTNDDANNVVITVSENTTCSKSGTTFSHWAVTSNGPSVTPLSPVAYPGESYDTTGCVDDTGDSFVFTAVYTSDNARTTSQPYVYNRIQEETQIKIPATNPSNMNIGNTVITYTNVEGGGVIGERELFTGGTYDADNDSGKLITAGALNNAFTNLPTTDTTKLQCANQSGGCTLWTIIDQTAYGINGDGTTTTIDLMSLIGDGGSVGAGYISNNGGQTMNVSTYGLTQNGTFVINYGSGKKISGRSQCSSRGVANIWYGNNDTFESDHFTTTLPDANGKYCYCTLDGYTTNGDNWGNMTALSAPWVFSDNKRTTSNCAGICAYTCKEYLVNVDTHSLAFRAAVFNSVQ